MALKKSALYSSLWKSCDELRGWLREKLRGDYLVAPSAALDQLTPPQN